MGLHPIHRTDRKENISYCFPVLLKIFDPYKLFGKCYRRVDLSLLSTLVVYLLFCNRGLVNPQKKYLEDEDIFENEIDTEDHPRITKTNVPNTQPTSVKS